jgi:hypothetical protein
VTHILKFRRKATPLEAGVSVYIVVSTIIFAAQFLQWILRVTG